MKHIFVLLITLFTLSTSIAQEESNWFTSKDTAIEHAKENNSNILIVFAGSDWCKPCIQFKQDILLSEDFNTYATDNLTILYLDFPMKKKNKLSEEITKHNEALAEEYNKSGSFPKIILTDKDLVRIKEIEFKNQSPSEFVSAIK